MKHKRQGPNSGPNETSSTSSTPTNLSSSQNSHLKNGQHLNCSLNNGLLDQTNSDCLDESNLASNGLLLDEDSLDEANTKSSLIINNMNTSINQTHLPIDNSLSNIDLGSNTNCQSNQLGSNQSNNLQLNASLQPNDLNASSSCSISQNSLPVSSVKLEQPPPQFINNPQLPSSTSTAHQHTSATIHNTQNTNSICTSSQNQYSIYQVDNYPNQLEDRKVDTSNCRANLLCNRQSSIDSYQSDSFNLLHNVLSNETSSNQNVNLTSSNNLNNSNHNLAAATTTNTTKRSRSKRNNQKTNNQQFTSNLSTLPYIKSDTTNCSPPSMIPTPPMENSLNSSSNQLNSNLIQSPLTNSDLVANTNDYYLQQQPRSSILSATLQNRPNNNQASYPSMELINNHRRAYPSPTSSTSSAYMSPNSQQLNHSPNSNLNTTASNPTNQTDQTKFSSHSMLHSNLNPQTNQIYQPQRMNQNSVFLYNSNNQPIQQQTSTLNSNDNQMSFNCETGNSKTYTNQCLSAANNIYNGTNIEQRSYALNSNSTSNSEFSSAPSQQQGYSNIYMPSNQQFMQQSTQNQNYQQSNYFNGNSTYQSANQLSNSSQFNFDQQYNSSSFLNNSANSNKVELFYNGDSNYHTGSSDYHANNNQMTDFTNDYYSDSVYNVCQPFNANDNFNTQDYQQLS